LDPVADGLAEDYGECAGDHLRFGFNGRHGKRQGLNRSSRLCGRLLDREPGKS
jgi:hypothetical protein